MFSEIMDGTSRASGPIIVSVLALAGLTYLMSQLIMHREAERAVPLCEAGYRAKGQAPSLEEFGRELTREFFKQMLPKESVPVTDWLTGARRSDVTLEHTSRCRCAADAALDDGNLRSRYWLWVGTLKLVSRKPDFSAAMARAERLGVCGKEA